MSTTPHNARGVSFDRVVRALADADCAPRPSGGGVSARCPLSGHTHGDRNPSLSVQYVAHDGRTRMRCHRCGPGAELEVLEALGLSLADLYDEPRTKRTIVRSRRSTTSARDIPPAADADASTSSPTSRGKRVIVARYDYVDSEGTPLLRALRYEPKGFSQQKWNGARWVPGAPSPENRVLYRLPQLLAGIRDGVTIHLTEGEKDADAICAAGGVATTVPMGAGKWQPQYAEQLRDASHVLVHADRDYLKDGATDDQGARHALMVRDALRTAGIPCTVVEAAEGKDAADHLAAGLPIEALLTVPDSELERRSRVAADRAAHEGELVGDNVLEHPTLSRLPAPAYTIPMARGAWAYETGGQGRRERGVYLREERMWRRVAPLPFVRARIVCREGTGRRTGTQYLLAATEDGVGSVINTDDLRTAAWAPILGIPLSDDDKVQKAVSTAIRYAAEDAEEREATPCIVEGRVSVPVAESVPAGYLVTAPGTCEEALATWRRIITEAARSPRLALVLGAAAVAPFVAATRGQSHIVALYGDPAKGKSTALELAAAIWGNPTKAAGPCVVRPWNASGLAVPRFLGELGVLPAVLDEIGQATLSGPAAWGKLIYDVCEGGSRMVSAHRGQGVNTTMPWEGILISAGNGRLTDGLGAGRYAGVSRRVVDIATPLTLDEAHADTLAALAPLGSGHLGVELLARHSAETVRPLIDEAAQLVGLPEDPSSRTIARHLHAHVAGAAMLDALVGTGTTLSNAALAYAREHLAELAPPEHDADRLLAEIRDAIGREPAMWPTLSAYEESGARKPDWSTGEGGQSLIPLHGINRTVSGIRADEDGDEQPWVGVFKATWRQIAEDFGLDRAVAFRELHARGLLKVTESRRRRQEWASQVKVKGRPMELYKLVLPPIDEDEDPENLPPAPLWPAPKPSEASVGGLVGGGRGSVGGEVGGTKPPLTCTVGGVGGNSDENSRTPARENNNAAMAPARGTAEVVGHLPAGRRRPCVVCSLPASTLVNGAALHTGECLAGLRRRGQLPRPSRPDFQSADSAADPGPPSPAGGGQGRTAAAGSSFSRPQASTREARWRAPAVVLDATTGYLSGGQCVNWPEPVEHLGDLAMLAHRDRLRLGHGGGETVPEPGQIWLWDAAAMQRLGLPASIAIEGAEQLSQDAFEKATTEALGALDDHPMLTRAKAAGWRFGQGGHLHVFTALWHPDLLPGGARIVVRPWHRLTSVALFEHSTDPAGLAQNIAQFADAVGIPYRISPGATALDLIDHTRPPRRSQDGISGRNERRVAVVRGEPAELPRFLRNPDSRTRLVESDYSWWRPWTSLLQEEQQRRYVHAYDRGASYLAQWSGVQLGVEGLIHRTGAEAAWDGTEEPGYYLFDKDWEWPAWGLPQPTWLAVVEGGRVWGTSHTLRQLAAVGISPTIHESYTWQTTARYLDKAAQRLREARRHPNPAVSATAKAAYAAGTGKLAEGRHQDNYHLWRPDWRDHVIAASRTGILRTLQAIEARCGDHALAVARDSIVFASAQADPVAAWPGDPGKLGTSPGQWKPEGTGLLADWGPTHLTERGRSRYWRHVDAMDALTGQP